MAQNPPKNPPFWTTNYRCAMALNRFFGFSARHSYRTFRVDLNNAQNHNIFTPGISLRF
jgi:hypothetical protein